MKAGSYGFISSARSFNVIQVYDSKRTRGFYLKKKKKTYKTLSVIISVKLSEVELPLEFPDFLVATGLKHAKVQTKNRTNIFLIKQHLSYNENVFYFAYKACLKFIIGEYRKTAFLYDIVIPFMQTMVVFNCLVLVHFLISFSLLRPRIYFLELKTLGDVCYF